MQIQLSEHHVEQVVVFVFAVVIAIIELKHVCEQWIDINVGISVRNGDYMHTREFIKNRVAFSSG